MVASHLLMQSPESQAVSNHFKHVLSGGGNTFGRQREPQMPHPVRLQNMQPPLVTGVVVRHPVILGNPRPQEARNVWNDWLNNSTDTDNVYILHILARITRYDIPQQVREAFLTQYDEYYRTWYDDFINGNLVGEGDVALRLWII